MSNKQSSIEWLMYQLYNNEKLFMSGDGNVLDELLKQSKEKHRKEILEARQNGLDNGFSNGSWDSNMYYEQEFNADSPTMEEFLDLEKMEQKLDTQLESETTESLNEWLSSKRSQFLDSCDMEDCPHCAYERQQEYEAELEKEAAIDFGDWLTGQGVSFIDSTEEGNVYMVESNMNKKMTMKQIYELYLKDQG